MHSGTNDVLGTVPSRVQGNHMSGVALQITVIVLLTLINGLFAMSETALVSSRKARLKQRAEAGDRGARTAMQLADSPNRFLSTVQIGISLVGVLAGAFRGRRSPDRWPMPCGQSPRWLPMPDRSPSAQWWWRSLTCR
jgi:Cyclin M transmembrane N-terminal domain